MMAAGPRTTLTREDVYSETIRIARERLEDNSLEDSSPIYQEKVNSWDVVDIAVEVGNRFDVPPERGRGIGKPYTDHESGVTLRDLATYLAEEICRDG
jgi:hypothetical protein